MLTKQRKITSKNHEWNVKWQNVLKLLHRTISTSNYIKCNLACNIIVFSICNIELINTSKVVKEACKSEIEASAINCFQHSFWITSTTSFFSPFSAFTSYEMMKYWRWCIVILGTLYNAFILQIFYIVWSFKMKNCA